MAKFCTKCGASLDDNASFCTSCGAKFDVAPATKPAATTNSDATILDKFKANANADGIKKLTANPNFTKYVGIGVVALVALIVIIILCSAFSGGYAKPVRKMFDAYAEKDGELLMECYSEYEIDYYAKSSDMSKKETEKMYKSQAKLYYELFRNDYGRDFKTSVDVKDKEKIEKSDLKDIEEYLQIKFDKKKLEVTKGYILDCEVSIKGDDDDDVEDYECLVLKIDGKWCITDVLDPDDDFEEKLEKVQDKD